MDYKDLGHRMLWTFVQAFVGALVVSGALELEISVIEAAAIAGAGDVLVLLKEFARKQLATKEDDQLL